MANKAPSKARIREWQEKTAKAIANTGRAVIAVVAEKGDETPQFAYTLGNAMTQDTPEVLTFYPSASTAQFVLNNFSDDLRDGTIEPFAQGEVREVFGQIGEEGCLPVRARLLTPVERALAQTDTLCQQPDGTPTILLELPDPNGKFADDPECMPPVVEAMANVRFRVEA